MTFQRPARAPFRIAVVTFIAAVTVLLPARAYAHAVLLEVNPGFDAVVAGQPEAVSLRFNEPVEISFGSIRVFDTRLNRVDDEAAGYGSSQDTVQIGLQDGLPDGTYTVAYRVISADSHPVSGAFVFHIGAPGERPQGVAEQLLGDEGGGTVTNALFGLIRWVNFTALLVLAGAMVFAVFVWREEARSRAREMNGSFDTAWRRLLSWAWVAAIVATLLSVVFQAATAGGVPLGSAFTPDVIGEVLGTRYGRMALLRVGVLLGAGLLWAATRSRPQPWSVGAIGLLLLVALATPGLAGHPGVTDPVPVNVAADLLHMLAAAAWMGGLVVLIGPAFRSTRDLADRTRVAVLAGPIGRFSRLAVLSVAVLVLTGTYRSWAEVRVLEGLTGTTYGLVLLSKVAVVLPILILGYVNNRIAVPALKRAAAGGDADGPGALTRLRRVVSAEVALGVVVVALSALLVNLAPARVEAGASGPFITDVRLGDANLNLIVEPNRPGENIVHLTVTDPDGSPAEVEAMSVMFSMPDEDIGPISGEGRELGPGHFVVQGRQLSIPGEWRLEVSARIDRFTESRATVEMTVNR